MVLPFFFFNDAAPTAIYTLSLHDALPICSASLMGARFTKEMPSVKWSLSSAATCRPRRVLPLPPGPVRVKTRLRSEEHTSELQSRGHLVCRLLLEKKKNIVCSHTM